MRRRINALDASGGSVKCKDEGGRMNYRAATSTQPLGVDSKMRFIGGIYDRKESSNLNSSSHTEYDRPFGPDLARRISSFRENSEHWISCWKLDFSSGRNGQKI